RLMGLIGTIGTVMLWVVIGVAYLVWRYNFSLVPKRGSLKEKAKKVARSYNERIGEDDSEKEVVTQSLGRKEARKELDEKERKKNEELGLKFREKEGKEYDKEGNEIVIDATRKNDPMELSISEKEKELSSKRRKKEERSAEDVELEITPSQEDEKAKKKSLAEKLVRDSGTYEPTLD